MPFMLRILAISYCFIFILSNFYCANAKSQIKENRDLISSSHPFLFASKLEYQSIFDSKNPIVKEIIGEFIKHAQSKIADADRQAIPYTGCNLSEYLKKYTFEDAGALRTASDLALYWYFVSSTDGNIDRKLAQRARIAAINILYEWASASLRFHNAFYEQPDEFCDQLGSKSNKSVAADVGLQIGRGVPYLALAYDILMSKPDENLDKLNTVKDFIRNINLLIRNSMNRRFDTQYLDCNRYSNHLSVQLTALLSTARILRDDAEFRAISIKKTKEFRVSFVDQVNMAIYKNGDNILNCYKNDQYRNFWQNNEPYTGEIVDRYRSGEIQKIGYPLFSLDHLLLGAELIEKQGYKAFMLSNKDFYPLVSASEYYSKLILTFLGDSESRVPGNKYVQEGVYRQYEGAIVSRGVATITGRDRIMIPILRAARAYPDSIIINGLIARLMKFREKVIPFGDLDSIAIHELLYFIKP